MDTTLSEDLAADVLTTPSSTPKSECADKYAESMNNTAQLGEDAFAFQDTISSEGHANSALQTPSTMKDF